MTDEVGPWLFRVHYEVTGWGPPEEFSKQQKEALSRLLVKTNREVTLAKVTILSHTFSIPGKEGRYIDVFKLISGKLGQDLAAISQKVEKHLREIEREWESAANLLNSDGRNPLVPPDVDALAKHYIFSCDCSSDGEMISLPSYFDAMRLKIS